MQFRSRGLKASPHCRLDQALRLGGAHAVAEDVGVATEVSTGAGVIAFTRSLMATRPAAGKADEPPGESTDEVLSVLAGRLD